MICCCFFSLYQELICFNYYYSLHRHKIYFFFLTRKDNVCNESEEGFFTTHPADSCFVNFFLKQEKTPIRSATITCGKLGAGYKLENRRFCQILSVFLLKLSKISSFCTVEQRCDLHRLMNEDFYLMVITFDECREKYMG